MRADLQRVLLATPTRKTLCYNLIASLLALALVSVIASLLIERVARQEATRDAQWVGQTLASDLVAPLVTSALRDDDPAAENKLDIVVRSRIASSSVVRIKVWDADGTVLYSDASQLIGRRFALDPDDQDVLRNGGTDSGLSELKDPENIYERQMGQLVEVYARAYDQTGRPLLVESYFSAAHLQYRSHQLRTRILPVLLSSLVVMELILLPLSIWLARRAERSERKREIAERLAAGSVLAERRKLAGELHDGLIQDLAAVSYALESISRGLSGMDSPVRETADRAGDIIRGDIATLRGMSTSLYAPDAGPADLSGALNDLVAVMKPHGVTADICDLPNLPVQVVSSVFQLVREGLRNAVRHSGDSPHLTADVLGARLLITITDQGRGYDPGLVDGPADGHLGLTLLRDAADRAGGELQVRTAPGSGTVILFSLELNRVGVTSGSSLVPPQQSHAL